MLPNYGVAPTPARAAWELRLSHWRGPLPVLEIWTDWSYRRFHHLYGRLTYRGGGVFGFKSTRFGVPLDTYGRTSSSTRSTRRTARAGSARISFLTHRPTGGFCYGFYPHGPHPVGNGRKYRATVIGPRCHARRDVGRGRSGAYDPSVDAQANAHQRTVLGAAPRCTVN